MLKSMFLDVIAGYYMPSAFGWNFLITVLLSESLVLSIFLKKKLFDKRVWLVVIFSNIVTTLIGYLLFDQNNDGGYLLSWIPINEYRGDLRLKESLLFFFESFALTIFIESIINIIFLRKEYSILKVLIGTIIINLITYTIAAVAISYYAYKLLYFHIT